MHDFLQPLPAFRRHPFVFAPSPLLPTSSYQSLYSGLPQFAAFHYYPIS